MQNVLAVINTPTFGGPHNQLLRLDGPLQRLGWRYVAVLPTEGGDDGSERLRKGGVEVVRIPLHRLRAQLAIRPHMDLARAFHKEVTAIRELIRSNQADVVQVCGTVNLQPALAARQQRVGVVWQLLSNFAPLPLRAMMSPVIAGIAHVVMTTGTRTGRQHPGVLSLSKTVMPFLPPVDTNLFKPDAEARRKARRLLNVADDAFVIGTVGNFNRQKAHERIIGAAPSILAQIPNAHIRILGSVTPAQQGYYEREVMGPARDANLLKDGRLGFESPGDRVAEFAPGFDVFILTSRSEGVPTAMLEAMSCGIPIVTPDVGSISEVVVSNHNGLILQNTDPENVVESLKLVASHKEFARTLSQNARRSALEHFSLEACAQIHVAAFNKALEGSITSKSPQIAGLSSTH
jgi:glycosyltransferase involved in cell wall biosynthesis